ncbi:hypothetical protein [Flavobacterium piscisymbiosum]|uniref:Uncharacterized protein n=1 Tax=Flavobacterium piscisymbiosum TaxID=2893753 RepID=A0ABS8MJL2_9FLAO|nr:hypothetical protein [Flavobacterium sp. F-30]MCC9065695.1 hypothetical protein [Flavobacterium sp. F-30]
MKNKKLFIVLFLILTCCLSCEKDQMNESNERIALIDKINIENGRLSFANKTAFLEFYNTSKKESNDAIASMLEERFYKNNFYSLKPIVNDETEVKEVQKHFAKIRQQQLINKSINSKNASQIADGILLDEAIIDHYDIAEDIIGDELFLSLLNEDAEIQVDDIIYKYTDQGVLFCNKEKIYELYHFMQIYQIKSLSEIGEMNVYGYPKFNPNGGLKQVTANITSFVDDKVTENNSSALPKPISNESLTASISPIFNNVVDNLEVCNPKSPWLANLFGKTKVCTTNYESKRRVKLKYYNVNLFLAYSIGVKVKNQFRGWTGIWREENTNEVALGVNSVTWFFDNSKIFSNNSNSMIANYYVTDTGKLYTSLNSYNNAIYAGTNKPIPNLPFKKLDMIIEVAADYIGKDLTEYQIRKLFYGSIYGQAEKIMKSLNKPMNEIGVIINQRGQTIVQYYNLGTSCTNCSDRQKTFDWAVVSPKITYTFGAGNGGDLNVKTGFNDLKFDFKNPKVTGINIYGMVNKNGTWHGFKMVF